MRESQTPDINVVSEEGIDKSVIEHDKNMFVDEMSYFRQDTYCF